MLNYFPIYTLYGDSEEISPKMNTSSEFIGRKRRQPVVQPVGVEKSHSHSQFPDCRTHYQSTLFRVPRSIQALGRSKFGDRASIDELVDRSILWPDSGAEVRLQLVTREQPIELGLVVSDNLVPSLDLHAVDRARVSKGDTKTGPTGALGSAQAVAADKQAVSAIERR